jgi:hypothetical protein
MVRARILDAVESCVHWLPHRGPRTLGTNVVKTFNNVGNAIK